jgi:hypothetical protein
MQALRREYAEWQAVPCNLGLRIAVGTCDAVSLPLDAFVLDTAIEVGLLPTASNPFRPSRFARQADAGITRGGP